MFSRKLATAGAITAVVLGVGATGAFAVDSCSKPNVVSANAAKATNVNCIGKNAIESWSVEMLPKSGAPASHGVAGGQLKVSVKLKDACKNTAVGLASYKAISPHPGNNLDAIIAQTKFDVAEPASGVNRTLVVDVPSKCYQVDLFTGPVIDTFGPKGQGFYSTIGNGNVDRLIQAWHGYDKCDAAVIPDTGTPSVTVPTTKPSTTTTTSTSTSTTSTTTTTTAPEKDASTLQPNPAKTTPPKVASAAAKPSGSAPAVLGATTPTTAPGAGVAAGNLAKTGTDAISLTLVGTVIAGFGIVLTGLGLRLRRRTA